MALREKKPGRCTWMRAIAFLVVCVVAGILIWLLPPWDEIIGGILPTFENTASGPSGIAENSPTRSPTANPTFSPTREPIPFSQCDPNSNTPCCNGLESNCEQNVNDIMYATAHNAMSAQENGFSGYNHLFSLEKSLERGFRALMLDLCDCGADGLQLCHSICAAGKRDPTVVFDNIYDFLSQNPEEILILVFQIGRDSTGQNPIDLTDLHSVMKGVPGFTDMIYSHPNNAKEWPTLQELIDVNQRLIIFHHEAGDCSTGNCPQGFHYYFQYSVETPFNFQNESELQDHTKSCVLDRGISGTKDFYNVNNFVTKVLPSEEITKTVNLKAFLEEHLFQCMIIAEMGINLATVDFWSIGDLLEVVQEYNIQIA